MLARKTWLAWTIAVAVAIMLALPATAMAITVRDGDSVVVAKDETISDDLYAFGSTITIDGTVDGDVIAFGQIVVVTGDVRGSVITAAQTVRIDGNVKGSVRAAGSTVDVNGQVGGDVLAGANQVTVAGDVKRDLAVGAQSVSITGVVGRNVMAASDSLTVAGTVGGDVEAQSTRVTVASQGSIAGKLEYTSANEADVSGSVSGETLRHEPPPQGQSGGSGGAASVILGAFVAWIQWFVGFLILGLFMVFAFRRPTLGGSQAVLDRPWLSLGAGLVVFFGTPMAGLFVFIVGLFVGAWWLAFVLFTVYWLLLLAGLIVGSLAVGRAILRKAWADREPALAWSFVLGLTLVWLAAAVPLLGWLAAWAVMMVGTGALVLLCLGQAQRPEPVVQPPTE